MAVLAAGIGVVPVSAGTIGLGGSDVQFQDQLEGADRNLFDFPSIFGTGFGAIGTTINAGPPAPAAAPVSGVAFPNFIEIDIPTVQFEPPIWGGDGDGQIDNCHIHDDCAVLVVEVSEVPLSGSFVFLAFGLAMVFAAKRKHFI